MDLSRSAHTRRFITVRKLNWAVEAFYRDGDFSAQGISRFWSSADAHSVSIRIEPSVALAGVLSGTVFAGLAPYLSYNAVLTQLHQSGDSIVGYRTWHTTRFLRNHVLDRQRRHGRGLSRPRHEAQTRCRHQDPTGGVLA